MYEHAKSRSQTSIIFCHRALKDLLATMLIAGDLLSVVSLYCFTYLKFFYDKNLSIFSIFLFDLRPYITN